MRIYFYQTSPSLPSDTEPSWWIAGDSRAQIFSPKVEFGSTPLTLPLSPDEEQIYFMPAAWEQSVLKRLTDNYPDVNWESIRIESKPLKEEILEHWDAKSAQFYENIELTVCMTMRSTTRSTQQESPVVAHDHSWLTSLSTLLSAVIDPMRLGSLMALGTLVSLIIVLQQSGLEQYEERLQKVEAIIKNQSELDGLEKLAEDWKRAEVRPRDNPAWLLLQERSIVKELPQNSPEENKKADQAAVEPRCYVVVAKKDNWGKIALRFYGSSSEQILDSIQQASLRNDGRGGVGVYDRRKKQLVSPGDWKILKADWELLIENPTQGQGERVPCEFKDQN